MVVPRLNWFSQAFEPRTDFFAMLNNHAVKTLEGMQALEAWLIDGASERCQRVRDLEREADEIKLDLERKLVDAFVTPFDREDIYDLSLKLDEVINSAKATVREIEAFDLSPDDYYLKEMATTLVEGTRCLVLAFSHLKSKPQEAADQATLARKAENRLTRIYRQAVRDLFALDDLKKILKTVEVYRCMVIAAEHIDSVGAKLVQVIVKIS